MTPLDNDAELDVEQLAQAATATVACCEGLIKSATPAERKLLAGVRDLIIEQAAAFTRSAMRNAEMDAVLFGRPAVLEAAIRSRLTPGQCAQLAVRLNRG